MKKVVVVLGLAKLGVPQKIENCRLVVTSMTGNANFPTPSPALAAITAAVNALETSYIAAKGGGKDETAVMYAKEQALEYLMKALSGYVELTASANPGTAEAVILGAAMSVRKPAVARANGFRLQQGGQPGAIQLRTDAARGNVFVWGMTQTPADEAAWQTIHTSTLANHLITGLQSGTRYYFRVAKIGREGQEAWSHALDLIAN